MNDKYNIYIYIVSKTKTEEALDFKRKHLKPESLDGVPSAFRLVELMEHVMNEDDFLLNIGIFQNMMLVFRGVYYKYAFRISMWSIDDAQC